MSLARPEGDGAAPAGAAGPTLPAGDLPPPPGGALKRGLDLAGALALLLLLAPAMALVALLLLAADGRPVLFRHERIGRGGRPFGCLKFRTMRRGAEQALAEILARDPAARAEWDRHRKLSRDPRVTPLGRFLRQTSLDELPQLVNVLRGEMSLVGPRPVTAGELARYGAALPLYLAARPGLTGPWQVAGRSDLAWEVRARLDAAYLGHWSLAADLRIVLATLRAVALGQGAR